MDKLRIGVVVDQNLINHDGGAFSYSQTLLNGINVHDFDEEIEVVNLVCYEKQKPNVRFKKPVLFVKGRIAGTSELQTQIGNLAGGYLKEKFRKSILGQFAKLLFGFSVKANNRRVEKQLADNKIDLIYYLKPEFTYLDYPFITAHWDVRQRSTYPFPEVVMNGNYEITESYYSSILNKALLIFCESEEGKFELIKYYAFNESKVKVMPLFGAGNLELDIAEKDSDDLLSEYAVQRNQFFLYPAQFWALKNHYNLLHAFKRFKTKPDNEAYKLVFCGSDKGNLSYIRRVISELNLDNSVVITGFVSDQLLYLFYTNATALVMPTFLGPTNMPLIEAAHLRCPVLCSDLKGHREIMAENALYFAPEHPASIEAALDQISKDETYRAALQENAVNHIKKSKFNLEHSLKALNSALLEIKPIRKTWGFDFVDNNSA